MVTSYKADPDQKRRKNLFVSGVHEESVDGVVVGVDHEGGPAAQVDVLLPPVQHVVLGPEF